MNDQGKKQDEPELLTQADKAAIMRQQEELLSGWITELSPRESTAWLEAHQDDLETKQDELARELADFDVVVRIAKGHWNPFEAIEIVRKKEHRTLEEAEALDAFERIKYKFMRVVSSGDSVRLKLVDLLEVCETKPKAEFEAMLAEADQDVLDRLKQIREAFQRRFPNAVFPRLLSMPAR